MSVPAPTAAQIEGVAQGELRSAGLEGQHAPALAAAFAELLGQALTIFVSSAVVLPGVPASAPPPALAGSTTGPGRMLAPPGGGPTDSLLEAPAEAALASRGLNGERRQSLAKALAKLVGQALMMFTAQMQVAPGIAIAGGVTSAPGMLIGAPPNKGALEPIAFAALAANKIRGEVTRDLAGALAAVTAAALTMLQGTTIVAPGIPCTPAATAGPGRLL